jgi:hypothetical protein
VPSILYPLNAYPAALLSPVPTDMQRLQPARRRIDIDYSNADAMLNRTRQGNALRQKAARFPKEEVAAFAARIS